MKALYFTFVVFFVPSISFCASTAKPDTLAIETATCPPQKIAAEITKQFEKSSTTAGARIKSIADATTGKDHSFEYLAFEVMLKGTPMFGQIEFDAAKCTVGEHVQFFKFRDVSSKAK